MAARARTFINCRPHLENHILAVAPEVLVTFGPNSCASVASLMKGATDADKAVLAELRDVDGASSLGHVMEGFHAGRRPGGIRGAIGGHAVAFVPLYHPSWSHVNHYQGDYEAVRAVFGMT